MTLSAADRARFDFGLRLVREAGALAQGYFRKRDALTVKSKGLQDVVSEADVETETLIRRALEKHFPDDGFLGEETGGSSYAPDQGVWVVDPIDGTQPFVSGMSSWCVSIGFVRGRDLKFGMVFAPERDELFSGGQGVAPTLNGRAIAAHPGRSLKDGIAAIGYSTRRPAAEFITPFTRLIEQGGMFYREGSGALALCYVASGRLIGYAEAHLNSWDGLGALAVCDAVGLKRNDFLAGDGLTKGARIVVGNADVFPALAALYD